MKLLQELSNKAELNSYWHGLNKEFVKWQQAKSSNNQSQYVECLSQIFGMVHKNIIRQTKDLSLDFLKRIEADKDVLEDNFINLYNTVSGIQHNVDYSKLLLLCNLALNLIDKQAAGYFDMTKGLLESNVDNLRKSLLGV
jgi:hypothetical protein